MLQGIFSVSFRDKYIILESDSSKQGKVTELKVSYLISATHTLEFGLGAAYHLTTQAYIYITHTLKQKQKQAKVHLNTNINNPAQTRKSKNPNLDKDLQI